LYGPQFPLFEFEEGADEANATVSRTQAHVTYEAGEYRLSDDASEFGTRVFRDAVLSTSLAATGAAKNSSLGMRSTRGGRV
jgi:hypothetical protein